MKAGRKLGENDTWIAATAKAAQRSLLTTDPDFLADHLKGVVSVEFVDQKHGR